MNKTAIKTLQVEPIKKRINAIIQAFFKTLVLELETNPMKVINFNESLLQDWNEMLQKMIFLKDAKSKQAKAININQNIIQMPILKTLSGPNATHMQCNNQFLLNLQQNNCNLYELVNKNGVVEINETKLAFEKGYIRKYCSYNFIDDHNVVLIGGSKQSNPNIKSKEIFRFNVKNSQISKIGQLIYGVSSHSAIKIKDSIFIVGGNKDMNMVTKSCLTLHIASKTVKKITDLNYPSASHSTISWKDQFIYKFGGIGSCFGSWDLSPYIERYNIRQNQWQIINPVLKVQQNLLDYYSLFASSLAYVTNNSSILIMGGFDFNFQGSNKVLQMSIVQVNNDFGQVGYQHQIINIATVDKLEAGGFLQQEPMMVNNQLIALQTVATKKDLGSRVVAFSKIVRYL